MSDPKGTIGRMAAIAESLPEYPGKKHADMLIRPLVEGPATRWSTAIIQRLLGYWLMVSQYPGGRAEIVDRGLMSRSAAYAKEADFRLVFGCEVQDFDPATLPKFFGLVDAPEATPET